ncbi:outer membrane autotransporter barrel domain-containing protein [Bartonella vinsonii subsp. arupensis OK-94-513]|uniref:Outer membrane autotransporter barrel domain-containing protein n=2 Tax=Bartonella vinsonii subsp. arupensis TaxID=110578 RepID=J0QUZ3_BARVI|nr:BafA family autotransporter [Bartonella vinsonii]EJF86939.1 outer membrane autotransporter barrel domain-containing protein [Bartonella vinsonii subsp. arupensis OK-94-513]EJF98774.1 outer membrane autotransporter barrel domain-containing protein [Bartonella vinsonii subsp. arupensis Pm136co]
MRHKYKLSFSILMISSCLVQIASAIENKNEGLAKMMSVATGGTVPKGSALVTSDVSSAITIQDGGVEIVDNGRISIGSTIVKGGMQVVTRAGTAVEAKILGGKQLVFEEKGLDLIREVRKSSAYKTIISGGDGVVGQQNVYDGAWVWDTKVMGGGEQNLYMGQRKEGGRAMNTEVRGNGRQHVLMGGESYATILKDRAVQVVYPGGFLDGLTINDSAKSWFHAGVKEVVGEVKVNHKGCLYLFAGDVTNRITKGKLSVEGRSDEILFFVGERHVAEIPQINIENLSGNGGTIIFTSIPYDQRHILLHVEELSGDLHFQFNISATGGGSDYLFIDDGAGNHKISVADSGSEITGSLLQKNGFVAEINLVTDKSGGANFVLANRSGDEILFFDGGAYIYGLYKRERRADSNGDSTIWYLGRVVDGRSSSAGSSSSSVKRRPKVITYSDGSSADRGTGAQSRPNNNGKRYKQPPQPRPPRHLREEQSVSVVSAGQNHFSEEQEQSVVSANAPSFTDQILLRPSNKNKPSQQVSEKLSISDFLTTPSTDAVLSLSVTPALVFKNELQTVRAGRGILERNKKTSALWTYAIKSKENVSADHIDFKLEQTGIILGIGGLNELAHGEFSIGGFGSYDKARVTHARGGVSNINTYGIGAYATYFDHSGWYLDSVLKYNHYQNTLNAVSTNGLAIEGNYNQWAVGTSFEAGYRMKVAQSSWIQPYAQLTWLQVEGKEIKLSNDMTGEINPFMSLRSEVGLSVGYEFLDGVETSLMGYITAAWLRENKDDNHTTINKQHQFVTDLSGNAGKLGIGLSSFLSDKLKLYAEAHYVKGHKTKQSLQGILGVRYSF